MKNDLFKTKSTEYNGAFFILGMHEVHEYFIVGVLRNNHVTSMGHFSEGLKNEEKETLKRTIINNHTHKKEGIYYIEPSICLLLSFQGLSADQHLIQAKFQSFLFKQSWESCTWEKLIFDQADFQSEVKITHPDKPIWSEPALNKEQFIAYLIEISPYMLPFLTNRLLTTIRYPHGFGDESFFQKNCPDYAPAFIDTSMHEGINYIVCNQLSTLVWLGNQLAIEYHIPFQTIQETRPLEIVFDLDPPDRTHFSLAIKAAEEMKTIFDGLDITSFPKLSGSKGIQIHIPILHTSLTFEDTRFFTEFIANYLVEKFPQDFTIERLKKNRGSKLYIDFIQHAEGKTIISPYSPRGREFATVAAPLRWTEVNSDLKIEHYNIPYIIERLSKENCPMEDFFITENLSIERIIESIKSSIKKEAR
ncbi:DNA ligase D [Cytobacillus purgationiresistens]|uniref:Bifunctional non-homologous end joining protein LigD n=1 Tax=Cytobacillus purgationiresistens TaxID=863449 RepID=A0ABU0AJ89_9BACI|nr:DNA ligase D [Cytobacillus purgationiresistens]MDQ0270483.1 bifunctional non-homologous end joining protein LigD [Cytobacillus purgationiresistens]